MNNMRAMNQAIRHYLVICLALCAVSVANAQSGSVFKMTVDKPMNDVYDNVYTSLEEARFFVVFEPNIGKNIAGFAGSKTLANISESLQFGAEKKGSGAIVYMVDNPLFRLFWEGGKLFFANALFIQKINDKRL